MRLGLLLLGALVGCGATSASPDAAAPLDFGLGCGDMGGPDGAVCLASVSGQLVDESGAPIAGMLLSVCAGDCFFGKSGSDGRFTVMVGKPLFVDQFALLTHARPDKASYYTRLPPLVGDTATYGAPITVPTLPASGPMISLDGGVAQTVSSGDVTLRLAANTTIMIDVEDFDILPLGGELRVLKADPAKLPLVDPGPTPNALYGFEPFEVLFTPPAQLSFANTSNLPAGAAVDVQRMPGLIGGTPPAGGFVHAANAHVSADGTRIDFDPGEGIGSLTWIALVKK
jgi:hypothetical protein